MIKDPRSNKGILHNRRILPDRPQVILSIETNETEVCLLLTKLHLGESSRESFLLWIRDEQKWWTVVCKSERVSHVCWTWHRSWVRRSFKDDCPSYRYRPWDFYRYRPSEQGFPEVVVVRFLSLRDSVLTWIGDLNSDSRIIESSVILCPVY